MHGGSLVGACWEFDGNMVGILVEMLHSYVYYCNCAHLSFK